MKLVLLSDFIRQNNLQETKVYTYLQGLKQNNFESYSNLIKQNEFSELLIDISQADDLLLALKKDDEYLNDKESEMINYFKEALSETEERYMRLFDAYLKLSQQLQIANEKLIQLTSNQQELIKEQIEAVSKRDPRSLAQKLLELEEKEIDERLDLEDEEENFYRFD